MEIVENTLLKVTVPYSIADSAIQSIEKCELLAEYGTNRQVAIYWGHDEAERLAQIFDAGQPNPEDT